MKLKDGVCFCIGRRKFTGEIPDDVWAKYEAKLGASAMEVKASIAASLEKKEVQKKTGKD